jgi:hypothetical protein
LEHCAVPEENSLIEEQLATERLMLVQDQIFKKLPLHMKRKILCPNCGHWNVKGNELCCHTLRKAVIAILSAARAMKTSEAAERSMQN